MVISAEDLPKQSKQSYHLSVLAPSSNAISRRIELGVAEAPPVGSLGHDGKRMWVNIRPEGDAEWSLIGFDLTTGAEFARFPIGSWRRFLQPRAFWSQEADNGKLLMTLSRNRGRVSLDSYRLADGKKLATVPLGRGRMIVDVFDTPEGRRALAQNLGERGRFVLVDLASNKVLWSARRREEYSYVIGSVSLQHLYAITGKTFTGMVRRGRGSTKEMVSGVAYEVQVVDSVDGSVRSTHALGYEPSGFIHHPDNEAIYLHSLSSMAERYTSIWRFAEEDVSLVRQHEAKCVPTGLVVDERADMASALCLGFVLHGRLDLDAKVERIEVRIAAESGLYSADRTRLVLGSMLDSKVATVDLGSLRLAGVSATGRGPVKAARLLAGTALSATGWFGVPTFLFTDLILDVSSSSSKTMLLNPDESRLYALNHDTRDITTLDATTLNRLGVHAVGQDVHGLLTSPESRYVFGVGKRRLLAFAAEQNQPALDLRGGRLVGFSTASGKAYYSDERGLVIYSLATAEPIAVIPELVNVLSMHAAEQAN
ncbi:MAG: hypothetical protein AAF515_13765 [Pseudomonadota bacterium]